MAKATPNYFGEFGFGGENFVGVPLQILERALRRGETLGCAVMARTLANCALLSRWGDYIGGRKGDDHKGKLY